MILHWLSLFLQQIIGYNLKRFKRHKDFGFFDRNIRLSKLSQLGDPLEKLNAGIDFELFRNMPEMSLSTQVKGPGGRHPYDYALMFKILMLRRYYNLPESFNKSPHRKAQKDVNARWNRKNNVNYYGCKNHVKSDAKSKLITRYMVTDASVHDLNATDPLLDENDKGEPFYADSAYTGEPLPL